MTEKMAVIVKYSVPCLQWHSVCEDVNLFWHVMPKEKFHTIFAIHSHSPMGGGGRELCLHAPSLQIFSQNAHGMGHMQMFGSRR